MLLIPSHKIKKLIFGSVCEEERWGRVGHVYSGGAVPASQQPEMSAPVCLFFTVHGEVLACLYRRSL